jgi:hypothetical protein
MVASTWKIIFIHPRMTIQLAEKVSPHQTVCGNHLDTAQFTPEIISIYPVGEIPSWRIKVVVGNCR